MGAAEDLVKRGRRTAFEHLTDDDEVERTRNRKNAEDRKRKIQEDRERKRKEKEGYSSGKASVMLGRRG